LTTLSYNPIFVVGMLRNGLYTSRMWNYTLMSVLIATRWAMRWNNRFNKNKFYCDRFWYHVKNFKSNTILSN